MAEEFYDLADRIMSRYELKEEDRAIVNITLQHLDLFPREVPNPALDRISRVCLVNEDGRVFDRKRLYDNGVWLDIQDEGRTLKIFNRGRGHGTHA